MNRKWYVRVTSHVGVVSETKDVIDTHRRKVKHVGSRMLEMELCRKTRME